MTQNKSLQPQIPLAERLRPQRLEDYIGQHHLLGEGQALRLMFDHKLLRSLILWGPPGVGKTTIAKLIAAYFDYHFFALSAVESGVKELRAVLDTARKLGSAVLFIDEIHRFNKSQQDSLLKAVEEGWVVLIGATTENPSFEVNNALLSRCQVYQLEALSVEDLRKIVENAIQKDDWLQSQGVEIVEWENLLASSKGDARRLLNNLEVIVGAGVISITNEGIQPILDAQVNYYDKKGDMHYDVISAFIKSVRGSHPDAALYWLARMIVGGEDPVFIARRLVILAAEDIGLANPNALLIANATFQSVQQIGMPEGRIPLAECTIYLATSPKSNSAYKAINAAIALAEATSDVPVPIDMRNAPTKLMKSLGYGAGYKYPHDYPGHFIDNMYWPEQLPYKPLYEPAQNASEERLRTFIESKWSKTK